MQKIYYIPDNVKYVFVSDFFTEDYTGGAELTFGAIINSCEENYIKIHSASTTSDLIQKYKDKYWIIGNFANLDKSSLIELVVSNVKFSIVEFDYKYCSFRSSHLHKLQTGAECDCHKNKQGLFIRQFFAKAHNVFFMSSKQKNVYEDLFPLIKPDNFHVLSSIFSEQILNYLTELRIKNKDKNEKYVILKGGSWIKAEEQTKQWAHAQGLKFDLLGNMKYEDFIKEMSKYKGLIFMPAGFDTCPRIVIEAKLLGLECILNDNVQHKDEPWFKSEIEVCEKYLSSRTDFFWNIISK